MISEGILKDSDVVVSVKEDEVILSLFCTYILKHTVKASDKDHLKVSIAEFTYYIENWLRDHYGCDD